jgi:hypothetical protein
VLAIGEIFGDVVLIRIDKIKNRSFGDMTFV